MTGGYVVDASVAIKWFLPEADSAAAVALLDLPLVGPDLLAVECANILWKQQRRGLLSLVEAEVLLHDLLQLDVRYLPTADLLPGALRRAGLLRHPVHDCLYLEAAAQSGLPLVTADQALARLPAGDVRVLTLDQLP